MAKYKAVRKKQDLPPQVRQGVPCLVIIVVVIILTVFVMYFAMKNAG
jgi:CHASE1-domain containing sensor protein